jgi:hypothetical protein
MTATVHTLDEALRWFFNHPRGSVICADKSGRQTECFTCADAERFYASQKIEKASPSEVDQACLW